MPVPNLPTPSTGLPLTIVVDGITVRGEILALYPNDMEVAILHPFRGRHTGVHIPWFAMYRHRWLATVKDGRTQEITPRGRDVAAGLLRKLYEKASLRPARRRVG